MHMQLIMLLEARTAAFPRPDYFIGPLIKKRKKEKSSGGVNLQQMSYSNQWLYKGTWDKIPN